jgi:glutathione S-transferase
MKLYGSLTSPFVRKVRAFAIERGVSLEMVVEDPWQVSPRLIGLNPAGKVPVLQLNDGSLLVESLLIIEFLDSIGDPAHSLIPKEGKARWDALLWHARAQALIDSTVARTLELRRAASLQMPARISREEARFGEVLAFIERNLPHAPWIAGENISVGDVMLAVALRYAAFRYPHDWEPGHPRVAARLHELASRPCIRDTEPPNFP